MRVLSDNMAWVMKSMSIFKDSRPPAVEKVFSNFVR
jgi:hypothetical protein